MLNIVGNYSRSGPSSESRVVAQGAAAGKPRTIASGTRDGRPDAAAGPIRWEHHERISATSAFLLP